MIVIIDYGMGNLGSVKNMLKRIGYPAIISSKPEDILNATKLILPGVGAFGNGMKNIENLGILKVINKKVLEEKTPILGICLGMQLMAMHSEEGNANGLGWFSGNVIKFKVSDKLKYKIPHIGWNHISVEKPSKLMNDMKIEDEFYFVHAYHYQTEVEDEILNKTRYEYDFVSAIQKNNIFAVQYHPEKSHDAGEKLFRNFIQL